MEKQHLWLVRGWANPKSPSTSNHPQNLNISSCSPPQQPHPSCQYLHKLRTNHPSHNFTGNPKSIISWSLLSAKAGLPTTGTINPCGLSHSATWSQEIPSHSLVTLGFFLLHHPKGSLISWCSSTSKGPASLCCWKRTLQSQKCLHQMLLWNKYERFSSALLSPAQAPSPGARI